MKEKTALRVEAEDKMTSKPEAAAQKHLINNIIQKQLDGCMWR